MEFSLSEILKSSTAGTLGVIITLMIMSVLSISVAVNRALYFVRARRQSVAFAGTVAGALRNGNPDGVLKVTTSEEFKFSYLARIVRSAIDDARDWKTRVGSLENLETVSAAMERAVGQEGASMRKWMTILATVSSTAPFVGLLGTVLGIINSFKGMASSGSGGLGAVAGGIAEALFTTGLGLVVAIPAVWLYNWANASVDELQGEMTNASSEMLDWVRKNRSVL